MKKIMYCAALFAALTFSSCSDDEVGGENPNNGNEEQENTTDGSHLDLWLSVDGTSSKGTFVAHVGDPTNADQTINVTGSGVEVTGKMTIGAIQKDGYYYFATEGNDGLAKYILTDTKMEKVGECPYGKNIFKKGGMTGAISATHEWIGDDVLLLSQYSTVTKKHIWSKYDTKNMKILSEGEFDLHKEYNDETIFKFSTSGHIRYRKNDGKLIFFTSIHHEDPNGEPNPMNGQPATKRAGLAVVVIDEKTMEIEKAMTDDRVAGLALESYGDTQQEKAYFDQNGDLYLICLQKGSNYRPGGPVPECVIIRTKAGESETDKGYLFKPEKDTDILITRYLSPGKALVFAGDHEHYYNGNPSTGNSDNFINNSYYYAIFDSQNKTLTRLKMDGEDLPWSTGGFNNYIASIGETFYIGVNSLEEDEVHQAYVYSLDAKTEEVKKAFSVDAKLDFKRMYSVKNTNK